MSRFALVCTLTAVASVCHAQDSEPSTTTNSFPLYVQLTAPYKYPKTQWASPLGEIEKAISEDATNWDILTPNGDPLKLPKSITKKITADEAVSALNLKLGEYTAIIYEQRSIIREMEAAEARVNAGLQKMLTLLTEQNQQRGMSASDMNQTLRLMQTFKDLQKRPDKRQIPNQNRYEIITNP